MVLKVDRELKPGSPTHVPVPRTSSWEDSLYWSDTGDEAFKDQHLGGAFKVPFHGRHVGSSAGDDVFRWLIRNGRQVNVVTVTCQVARCGGTASALWLKLDPEEEEELMDYYIRLRFQV